MLSFQVMAQMNLTEALQKALYFYDAQRCGPGITGEALDWRGDCHLYQQEITLPEYPESGTYDFSGGFHTGGHGKSTLSIAFTASTLGWAYYEFKDSFILSSQEDHQLQVLKLLSDYLLKCEIRDYFATKAFVTGVGNPLDLNVLWGPPETEPMLPGSKTVALATADNPESGCSAAAAAALAVMSINYRDKDNSYGDICLAAAKRLYNFARENRGGNGGYFSYYLNKQDEDELSLAAVWLYEATEDSVYIDHIISDDGAGNYTGYAASIIPTVGGHFKNTSPNTLDYTWAAVFTKLQILFPSNVQYENIVRWNLAYWGAISHNMPGETDVIKPLECGYVVQSNWNNAQLNSSAQFSALVYNKYHPADTAPLDWARGQMEFILGDNPLGLSFLIGYGDNYPQHPFHRAAHGSPNNNTDNPPEHKHILVGGLISGPSSEYIPVDSDGNPLPLTLRYNDNTSNYVENNVDINYNASFIGALAGLYNSENNHNEPLINVISPEGYTEEFFVTAKKLEGNPGESRVLITMNNETVSPPRFEQDLSCRYYFDISELIAAGQTQGDVEYSIYADQAQNDGLGNCTVSGPYSDDIADTAYFMEFDWNSITWYGGMNIEIGLTSSPDSQGNIQWDEANDYSNLELSNTLEKSAAISVYQAGSLIGGIEPFLSGDANNDGSTNIIDALITAQYYVGLDPQPFTPWIVDVDCSGSVTIKDALLIAQYYVGLINSFPCTPSPFPSTATPTATPTPIPTETPTPHRTLIPTPGTRHVSVLPVFVVPSDQTHLIPDPYDPDVALSGDTLGFYNKTVTVAGKSTYYGSYQEFYNRAKKNLSAQLQTAQLKYEYMIEESTGQNMGSFALSTWNDHYFASEIFNPAVHNSIDPYIFVSRYNMDTMVGQLENADYNVISEILDELELDRYNCPYIFFTIYLFDPSPDNTHAGKPGGGGRPLNYGFDGGGYLHLSYTSMRNNHIPGTHGLSTIIHELGHTFGMPHVWSYQTPQEADLYGNAACSAIPLESINFSKYCSSSIMSYNQSNWIEGGIKTSPPEGTGEGRENNFYCLFEDTPSFKDSVRNLPGILIPENIEQLGRNDVSFPDLSYSAALYPGYTVRIHNGYGDTTLPVLEKEYSHTGYMFNYEEVEETFMRPRWSRAKGNAHGKSKHSSGRLNIRCAYDGVKMGYELCWDKTRVGFEPSWTKSTGLANLEWNKNKYHPDRYVEGFFEGTALGYELFHDNNRIDFYPLWTKQEAIDNCQENKDLYHPDIYINGIFEGKQVGYELFWDGSRVGLEPGWSKDRSIINCELNKNQFPSKEIKGLFEGKQMGYELFLDGIRTEFEPAWTKTAGMENYQLYKDQHHPDKLVEGYFDGKPMGYQLYWDGVLVGFEPAWTLEQAVDNCRQNTLNYPNIIVEGRFEGDILFKID